MSEQPLLNQLIENIVEMELENAKEVCEKALSEGIEPSKIIQEGIIKAVQIIGDRFEDEEYFLPELIMGGEIIKIQGNNNDVDMPTTAIEVTATAIDDSGNKKLDLVVLPINN